MRDVQSLDQSLETPITAEDAANRQAEFRRLMGQFATGVCVVSTPAKDGGIAAMTVNSFASVSLDPMLVSWNLHNSSSQFELYSAADHFAVSILAADQAELAQRYAGRGDQQLLEQDFTSGGKGLPVIAGALVHFECRRWSTFPAGDHTVIFGEILGMSANTLPSEADAKDSAQSALGFFGGKFCSIGK